MSSSDFINTVFSTYAQTISQLSADESYDQAIDALSTCQGKVICTGIGKAGIIGHKLASTLCSGATPAVFLHPGEAAHGDLGIIGPQDVMVALSTSGKSREVLEVVELAHHIAPIPIIAITSHPDGPIRKHASITIEMGELSEVCPLGLTPSTSTTIMQTICDALALATLKVKGTSSKEYALRHHGGYLGRVAREDNQ